MEAQLFVLEKKYGSMRLCVDYRELNKKLYPIKCQYQGLGTFKITWKTLVLYHVRYNQVYHYGFMLEESSLLTAFTTPRIPFGLRAVLREVRKNV